VWLHHGSSISHGSNAASPATTWPALAATAAGVDLVNLGFSGNALLDPFTARALRDTPADLISVKLGINVVNADLMRLRAFGPAVHGFLDTIRDGHPDTPLVVVSPLYCPIHERTPGPGDFDHEALARGEVRFRATGEPGPGKLTLEVIREELARISAQRQASDPHLTYLDGLARPIKTESGYGTTTVSIAETQYDSCGCSPLGKTDVSDRSDVYQQQHQKQQSHERLSRPVARCNCQQSFEHKIIYHLHRQVKVLLDERGTAA